MIVAIVRRERSEEDGRKRREPRDGISSFELNSGDQQFQLPSQPLPSTFRYRRLARESQEQLPV